MDLAAKLSSATLGLDVAVLRSTLEQLRQALERQQLLTVAPVASLVHDRETITESIRHILDRLDALDLTAIQALSGVIKEYRTDHVANQLRQVFVDLQRGWRERVRAVLGVEAAAQVARLLKSPAPDLLRMLGKEDDENSHSDLIAWLLNPWRAPVIAPRALQRLTARFDDDGWGTQLDVAIAAGCVSVRREVVIARDFCGDDDLARVDISVSGPGFILAIENKVWSREHHDQTHAYWGWIEPMRGLRGGLFLSPSGIAATCPQFRAISYLELVSCLVDATLTQPISQSEEIVLASYLKTLAREIIQVEMRAVRELAETENA